MFLVGVSDSLVSYWQLLWSKGQFPEGTCQFRGDNEAKGYYKENAITLSAVNRCDPNPQEPCLSQEAIT